MSEKIKRASLKNWLLCGALLAGLLQPVLLWWGYFSGDSEIHLAYAYNMLRGHMLEFNIGEANSGETSMGFMLLVALLMRLFGMVAVPYLIKIICLLSLYVTGWLVWKLGREIGLGRDCSLLAAVFFLCMPGNAYAAMYATENIFFAALGTGFLYWIFRAGWFDAEGVRSVRSDVALGIAAGLLFWLRPEAAPMVGLLLGVRLLATLRFKRKLSNELLRTALFSLIWFALIVLYVVIFRRYAGNMPFGAGKSRRLISTFFACWHIFGINISYYVLERLAIYACLTLPALYLSVRAIFRLREHPRQSLRLLAMGGIFFGFIAGYVFTFLPSVHIARYSLFLWPYAALLAAVLLQELLSSRRASERLLAAALIAWFALACGTEVVYRRRAFGDFNPFTGANITRIVAETPALRAQNTRTLEQQLGVAPGAHVNLAEEEVQLRYAFEDNITILSEDGITDSRLLPYFCDKWIDHDGYFIDTKADFIASFVSDNADPRHWSIDELSNIPIGASLVRPGITYQRIGPDLAKVTRTLEHASDRPGGICPANNR